MALKIDYRQFWEQLGLSNVLNDPKSTRMHNLVAKFLFEHPQEFDLWERYEAALRRNRSMDDPIPSGFEGTGYYSVLKKACALYEVSEDDFETKPTEKE